MNKTLILSAALAGITAFAATTQLDMTTKTPQQSCLAPLLASKVSAQTTNLSNIKQGIKTSVSKQLNEPLPTPEKVFFQPANNTVQDDVEEYLFFLKPEAVTDKVIDLAIELLSTPEFGFEVQQAQVLSGKAMDQGKIITRHYQAINTLATYGLNSPSMPQGAIEAAKEKFGIADINDVEILGSVEAVNKGAIEKAQLNKLVAASFANKTDKAPRMQKLAPGNYLLQTGTEYNGKPLYIINAFHLGQLDQFTARDNLLVPAFHVRASARNLEQLKQKLSDAESNTLTELLRQTVIGETNPAKAVEGSFRRTVYDKWQELGLASQPGTGPNSCHWSAGPIEAMRELSVWFNTPIGETLMGKKLIDAGVPEQFLAELVENPPMVQVGTQDGVKTEPLYDATEGMDTTLAAEFLLSRPNIIEMIYEYKKQNNLELIPARVNKAQTALALKLAALDERKNPKTAATDIVPSQTPSGPADEEYLFFIKPEAVNPSVIDRAIALLETPELNLSIDKIKVYSGKAMAAQNTIPQHYQAINTIARLGTKAPTFGPSCKTAFEKHFSIPTDQALLLGAIEIVDQGYMSKEELNQAWNRALTDKAMMTKLGPGNYVAATGKIFDGKPLFAMNGFHLGQIDQYTAGDGKTVVAFHVKGNLSADQLNTLREIFNAPESGSLIEVIRDQVIGGTNPATAKAGTFRNNLFIDWQKLLLEEQPGMGPNGCHWSAGPIEAMKELNIWFGISPEKTVMGRILNEKGFSKEFIQSLMNMPPMVSVIQTDGSMKTEPLYDATEGMSPEQALVFLLEQQSAKDDLMIQSTQKLNTSA